MNKKYQVFVSSTYEDLKEERSSVITALLKAGFMPTGMEYFTATSKSQWEVIEKIIPQCDYYVVIVAGKYGSIEPVSDISYTEKEYDLAVKSGIPAIAFLYKDIENLPAKNVESDATSLKKLNAFREKLKKRLSDFWMNKDDLAAKVLASFHKEVVDSPRVGWVRSNAVASEEKRLDTSFLDAVADLHMEITGLSNDGEQIVQKSIETLQWGDILEKVCSLMTTPLTFIGAKEEIANLWFGLVEADVNMIIYTFVNEGILEVGTSNMEGLGVQQYCAVTPYGHELLAKRIFSTNAELALRDKKTVTKLMSCFSTGLMDEYLREGPLYINADLVTSFDMCESIVTASSFTLYGETTNRLWRSFYKCWEEAICHYEWYTSTNNNTYRFCGLQGDRFVTDQDENNFKHLVDNRTKLYRCYSDFISFVKDTLRLNVEESSLAFEEEQYKIKSMFKQ